MIPLLCRLSYPARVVKTVPAEAILQALNPTVDLGRGPGVDE
jgi:hypothetical protein